MPEDHFIYGKYRCLRPPPPAPRGTVRLASTAWVSDLTGPSACALADPQEEADIMALLGPDPIPTDADPEVGWERLRRKRVTMSGRVAVLVACVAITGCTDSGDGRLTREEFITQADAICASANARVTALADPATLADLAELSRKALAISSDQLDRLRALRPPQELEAALAQAYALTEEQNELVGRIADAAEGGDEGTIEKLVAEAIRSRRSPPG